MRSAVARGNDRYFFRGVDMSGMLKTAGIWGSVILLVALAIAFLKQALALVGILLWAVKAIIALVFIALLIVVGYMAYKHFTKD